MDNATLPLDLLGRDYIFFQDGEIAWDGNAHRIVGVQVNAAKVDEFQAFQREVFEDWDDIRDLTMTAVYMLSTLAKDENFRIPRKNIAPGVAQALPEGDLTAITFANLCACDQAMTIDEAVTEDWGDIYLCAYDTRLSKGIPYFFNLVARLMWDLRKNSFTLMDTPFKLGFMPTAVLSNRCLGEVRDFVSGAQEPLLFLQVDELPQIDAVPNQEKAIFNINDQCVEPEEPLGGPIEVDPLILQMLDNAGIEYTEVYTQSELEAYEQNEGASVVAAEESHACTEAEQCKERKEPSSLVAQAVGELDALKAKMHQETEDHEAVRERKGNQAVANALNDDSVFDKIYRLAEERRRAQELENDSMNANQKLLVELIEEAGGCVSEAELHAYAPQMTSRGGWFVPDYINASRSRFVIQERLEHPITKELGTYLFSVRQPEFNVESYIRTIAKKLPEYSDEVQRLTELVATTEAGIENASDFDFLFKANERHKLRAFQEELTAAQAKLDEYLDSEPTRYADREGRVAFTRRELLAKAEEYRKLHPSSDSMAAMNSELDPSISKNNATLPLVLLYRDYIFFKDDSIQWDGNVHSIAGVQVNAANYDELQVFGRERFSDGKDAKELIKTAVSMLRNLSLDEEFRIPRSEIAEGISCALPEGDLTGVTLANLCACDRALIVTENLKATKKCKYTCNYDPRLRLGIPHFFDLVARLVWDLRKNSHELKDKPFEISFAPNGNHQSKSILNVNMERPGVQEPVSVMWVTSLPKIGGNSNQP